MNRIYLLFVFLLPFLATQAQAPKKPTSAEIFHAIQKLNTLGTAMYIAAHPDDENTRIISWLSNEKHIRTAYLSLTRGDGGQNLIGPEIQELLGVIRTQELLAARRIDGGEQFFTRANDFGYSKSAEETLEIWNEEKVVSDAVWAIRKFRPDVLITRFQDDVSRRTHGHHTASAIIAARAFELAGDPEAFPEQLEYVEPWQPKRMFFNTSWWFYGNREKFAEADKSKMLSVDVGVYYPDLGQSNTEIAALSRSMHKCQGFGSSGSRGSQMEYLQLKKGDMPTNKENIFEGVQTDWNRVDGGAAIGALIQKVLNEYDVNDPAASVPDLLEAKNMIDRLGNSYWKTHKQEEIKQIIRWCLGLFVEASAARASATPGETIELEIEAINRSNNKVHLTHFEILPQQKDSTLSLDLVNNESHRFFLNTTLPDDMAYSTPYWLDHPWEFGMYTVKKQTLRGLPETPRKFKVQYSVNINGVDFDYSTPVIHKYTDPVNGEVYQPFEILPPVFVNIAEPVYVFAGDEPKSIDLKVKAGVDQLEGQLSLSLPDGWVAEPERVSVSIDQKGAEQRVSIQLTPPQGQDVGELKASITLNDKTYDQEIVIIDYDHIPLQTVLRESKSKIVKVDLEKAGNQVGYIMGAGDQIPASLEQIGYQVDVLDPAQITTESLNKYTAVILGIRAYNTVDRMPFIQPDLMEYVKEGGTLITQYNTSHRLVTDELSPYSLQLSRDRVTVEEAEVTMLKPDHPILNYPNDIKASDFDHWVQERGLYFPDEWSNEFEAILSCHDPGEDPKKGGLLVAKYGDGYYIYTGYSWFRQLPAGVPGAYRIFTNMISIGQEERP